MSVLTSARGAADNFSDWLSSIFGGQARRLFRMQSRLRSNEPVQILVCALTGLVIGALVAGLRWLVDLLHQLSFNLSGEHSLSTGIDVDPLRILVVPLIGGLVIGVSALIMRRLRPKEIVDPIEANALHGGIMSMLDSLRLLVATITSNAAGAAVGMEAGYSQLGAGILAKVGQYFRLRRNDQRIFVGAGAAAAIAAAFNAPFAGAFYGYELILGDYSVRALAPVATAALAGTFAERALIDPEPIFSVEQFFHFDLKVYFLFGLLGVCAAGFSVLAMQSVTWVERALRRLPLPQWLRPAIGGVLLSAIAILVPQVLGSGHGAIQLMFDRNVTLQTFLLLLVAKLVASAVSLGSGFRGGMFSASLFLGCLFGGAFAGLAGLVLPQVNELQSALMMVGMGAVAAAIIGAPLTMVFLVLEGTGSFAMMVAVMVGVVIASSIVRLTFGYSFSTWRFHQRGLGIRSPHDIGWLADLSVGRLMRSDAPVVPENMPLRQLRERFPPGSAKYVFVVSEKGIYIGMLSSADLHDSQHNEKLDTRFARDLASDGDLFLLPYENVRTALSRFEDKEVETLPVLTSSADRSIVGYLSEQYALRRYNQELERRRSADLGERDMFSVADKQM
ncbi:chloride channel protein, CIC family [Enhydrobacter aerosaccus]|uniref:Chloride channel protein, CIC family n=1 Tax=Enhydrobacter aerosaccus TaxID=225324 RepID=A0A1T4KZG3_9HYPH|nr:chloride channel protein [Enhydrobacter aerosaccus]SJZ47700.1 chloride channel protein, CIC family [Enhydrobacter aerosaccus]